MTIFKQNRHGTAILLQNNDAPKVSVSRKDAIWIHFIDGVLVFLRGHFLGMCLPEEEKIVQITYHPKKNIWAKKNYHRRNKFGQPHVYRYTKVKAALPVQSVPESEKWRLGF